MIFSGLTCFSDYLINFQHLHFICRMTNPTIKIKVHCIVQRETKSRLAIEMNGTFTINKSGNCAEVEMINFPLQTLFVPDATAIFVYNHLLVTGALHHLFYINGLCYQEVLNTISIKMYVLVFGIDLLFFPIIQSFVECVKHTFAFHYVMVYFT